MLRAVVFDLDDTLYPERVYVESGFRAVAVWTEQHLGVPAQRAYAFLLGLFEAGVRGDTFDRFLKSEGVERDGWVPRMVRVYREHEPRIASYPEVPELLGRLRARLRLGLVTDGQSAVQRGKMAALGLAPSFDAVVYNDEFGRRAWKPSPRGFQIVLERLGVEARAAVYVGDNPVKDFLGARGAGMSTVRVRSPLGLYSRREPVSPRHAPEAEITELRELEAVLERVSEWMGKDSK